MTGISFGSGNLRVGCRAGVSDIDHKGPKLTKLQLAAAMLSFVVTVGGLEICIRIFAPLGSEKPPEYLLDDEIGWIHAPSQSGSLFQRNYSAPDLFKIKVRTNGLGMRDREYSLDKGGKARILVLGDSMTVGWGVQEEQAYPKVLEARYLRGVEVWNMGVVGYSTDQEYLQLRGMIDKARPDIVMVGFYENDVADNATSISIWHPYFIKPLFALEGDKLVLTNRADLEKRRADAERRAHSLLGRMNSVLMHSALFRWVRFAVRKRVFANQMAERVTRVRRAAWFRYNLYRTAESEELRNAWRLTEALLEEIRQLCDAHGAKLLVIYIPRAAEAVPGILEQQRLDPSEPMSAFDLSRPERRLEEISRRNGISLLGLSLLFHRAPRPEEFYLPIILKDGHLSAIGHALIAKALAQYLQNAGWLPGEAFRDGTSAPSVGPAYLDQREHP